MMTSSTPKNTTSLPCGDSSKNLVIDKSHTCRDCSNPIGFASHTYPDADFSNSLLVCPLCGHENADLSGFYIVDKQTGHFASSEFSTIDKTKQFADIFGMSEQSGYGIP